MLSPPRASRGKKVGHDKRSATDRQVLSHLRDTICRGSLLRLVRYEPRGLNLSGDGRSDPPR